MTLRERERYHQLHPAKLLVDSSTAIAGGVLFWRRQPLAALAVGFVPAIAVTLLFLSGRFDRSLEAVRNGPLARAIAPGLSADVNALRFGGLAMAWAGCGLRRAWPIPAGLFVILAGWWRAWRRGVARARAAGGIPPEMPGQAPAP
jgi:hypothetical protein